MFLIEKLRIMLFQVSGMSQLKTQTQNDLKRTEKNNNEQETTCNKKEMTWNDQQRLEATHNEQETAYSDLNLPTTSKKLTLKDQQRADFEITHNFRYKQSLYKQLALGREIAKQFSGLDPLPLSNNKNYRLKKNGFFLCDKRKIAVKPTMHQNSAVSKALLGKS